MLPVIRSLDTSRMVILGSGRWDGQFSIGSISNPGSDEWEYLLGNDSPDAAQSKMTWGGYTENSGDAHVYPVVPQSGTDYRIYPKSRARFKTGVAFRIWYWQFC